MSTDVVNLGVEVLKRGKKILVAGVERGSLNGYKYKDDHRLLIWYADENKNAKHGVSTSVDLVILMRFVSRQTKERITSTSPKTCICFHKLIGAGEMKSILSQIFDQVPLPEIKIEESTGFAVRPRLIVGGKPTGRTITTEVIKTSSVPTPTFSNTKVQENKEMEEETETQTEVEIPQMTIPGFVKQYGNLDALEPTKELNRLVELSNEQGLNYKFNSMNSAFYKLKNKAKEAEASRITTTVKSSREITVTTSVAPPASTSPKTVEYREESKVEHRSDAVKLLAQFAGSADILAVAVTEVLEENSQLRGEVTTLKEQVRNLEDTIKKSREALNKAFSGN